LEAKADETNEALIRAREVIEEMGHNWAHTKDSTHACKLCSIERKNGFPVGFLVDRDRRRYWVKKDRRERKEAERIATERRHQLPHSHPMSRDQSLTPTVPAKKKKSKPIKKKRSTAKGQRKGTRKRFKE
tara:strand:+ start:54971 stop:55360 length:390 start_codon:yes stop_codon:yes gene_type:complete